MRLRPSHFLLPLCTLVLAVVLLLPILMVVRGGFWEDGHLTLRYLAGVFRNPASPAGGQPIVEETVRQLKTLCEEKQ